MVAKTAKIRQSGRGQTLAEKKICAPLLFIWAPILRFWVPFLREGNDMAVVIRQVNCSVTCKCFVIMNKVIIIIFVYLTA